MASRSPALNPAKAKVERTTPPGTLATAARPYVHARAVNLRRDSDAGGIPDRLRPLPRSQRPSPAGFGQSRWAHSRRGLRIVCVEARNRPNGRGTHPGRFGARWCPARKTAIHFGGSRGPERVRNGACQPSPSSEEDGRRNGEGAEAPVVRRSTLMRKEAQEGTDLRRLATTAADTRPDDGARPRSRRSGPSHQVRAGSPAMDPAESWR